MLELNKDNFKSEVIASAKPVLVDFWAAWCMPCRMLSPTVEEIAEEYGDKIKVCKLNIDENPELAIEYGIMSIPTLMVFSGGKAVNKSVGVVSKEEILQLF